MEIPVLPVGLGGNMPQTPTKPVDLEDALSELVDDQDFIILDRKFGRFNIFEAMGAVRRELEHSNLLAYILSPDRPHGLGAEILRRILRAMLEKLPKEKRPIRALDIAIADLDDAFVQREQDNIDILIELPSLKLIVLIENKVGAKASEGQLERYKEKIAKQFPDWRRLLIFLTPEGTDPEDDDYLAFSYVDVSQVIQGYLNDQGSVQLSEIALILSHYLEMLRRHVVVDDELKSIALKIYERHKEALDFIFDSRPEPGSFLGVVRSLMENDLRLQTDKQISSIARFVPKEWVDVPALNACPSDKWTKSKRNLIFEIKSFKTSASDFSDRILLSLILGPSDTLIREHFHVSTGKKPELFKKRSPSINKDWTTIYATELLTKAAALKMDDNEKTSALEKAWSDFAQRDLPDLTKGILEIASTAPAV
jgi:hypothetical protein